MSASGGGSRLRMTLVLAGAGVLLLALGLAGTALFTPARPTGPSWLDFSPDAAQRKKIEDLRAGLRPGAARFPRDEVKQRDSAKLFTYMAGTSDEEPVVLAALDAVQAAYSSRSAKKEAPDRDLDRVLIKHLRSDRPARRVAAFSAARIPLMTEAPSQELTLTLVELTSAGAPGVRLAALEALDLLRPKLRGAPVLEAFLRATEQEPALSATALAALAHSAPSLAQRPELMAVAAQMATRLTRASDAGVRGRALELVTQEGFVAREEAAQLARDGLSDPHPYVRGVAATALGGLGEARDVHLLMPLIDDLAEARTTLAGTVGLDGTAVQVSLGVPGRRLVAETALVSLRGVAERWGEAPPPRLALGGHGLGAEGVQQGREQAHAWYEAHKARLPGAP